MNKRFQAILLGVVVALAMGGSGAYANCLDFGGFAIFQCADIAFFNPPPVPVTFDPNGVPVNVAGTFWQIGFGNHEPGKCTLGTTNKCNSGILNRTCTTSSLPTPDAFCNAENGAGTGGTGNSGLNDFNGNDGGIVGADLKDAQVATASPLVPFGSICVSSNNWGNSGVDGCSDNVLSATVPMISDDGVMNPLYNVYYARTFGQIGYLSYDWQQDHPMALLLTTRPDARFFAIAAVATLDRGNNGDVTGPCAATPGTNPAACDPRPGFYSFKDVSNGLLNPVTQVNNVIPWQEVPRPHASCVAGCSGTGTRTINFSWSPSRWFDDGSTRPSANALVGPTDVTRQNGVGVVDFKTRNTGTNANNFRGLIRYNLQSAAITPGNLDPNGNIMFGTLSFFDVFTEINQSGIDANGDPTGPIVMNGVSAAPDTCWRVQVRFGKKPEVSTVFPATQSTQTPTTQCRLGKCGDRGYNAASLDPNTITCVGGSLVSENAVDLAAVKKLGGVNLTWRMTSELSLQGFNIYTVSNKGAEKKIGSLPCQACNTGESKSYSFTAPMTQIKGAKSLILEVLSSNGNTRKLVNF